MSGSKFGNEKWNSEQPTVASPVEPVVGRINLDLSRLGIIDLDQKRALECYIDERLFRQRKSFSEYYVDSQGVELEIDIKDLMILAEKFSVMVNYDSVILEEY